MLKTSGDLVKNIYKKRLENSRKGNFGKLLVIGGSKEYTGAPALVGLTALKAGCDLVSVVTPKRAADIIASFSPNLITYPLKGDYLDREHFKPIEKIQADAIVFGNGLGENSQKLCQEMWKIKKPCVVDGDALKFIDRKLSPNFVLTPHAGEFGLMTGEKVPDNLEERKNFLKEYSGGVNCIVLLKGHIDLISDGKEVWENHTGNPYMTKAGTGDVLAGICGALMSRGIKPLEAAKAAAFISGSAGDLAAKKFGESLLATDVLEEIKNVINL